MTAPELILFAANAFLVLVAIYMTRQTADDQARAHKRIAELADRVSKQGVAIASLRERCYDLEEHAALWEVRRARAES